MSNQQGIRNANATALNSGSKYRSAERVLGSSSIRMTQVKAKRASQHRKAAINSSDKANNTTAFTRTENCASPEICQPSKDEPVMQQANPQITQSAEKHQSWRRRQIFGTKSSLSIHSSHKGSILQQNREASQLASKVACPDPEVMRSTSLNEKQVQLYNNYCERGDGRWRQQDGVRNSKEAQVSAQFCTKEKFSVMR